MFKFTVDGQEVEIEARDVVWAAISLALVAWMLVALLAP